MVRATAHCLQGEEMRKALGIKALHSRKISVLQPPCLSFPGNTKTSTSYMKSHFLE